ncbi:solute carrier family 13 member 1 isoform X2 [Falco rusticolus]|uniref:Solute carrier family 13 member 1 n=1 Tax=Falco tinnunculus TaxID=100819 RepID=A0A8C4UGK7_FALTI|nr:solute carrier family 13 member 1 [Falco peregrinus]XP_005441834.1 solute carrier family 13 member 1 [Falco cherrug]XP_037246041.1 solute carrier family 13 member 1 isoform X2 [Falco rusticolus]
MKILSYLLAYRRFLLIVLTPLLLLPLPLIIKTKEAECAYTLFIVAIFWLTEALPLAVSALLPAFMFPLFGIMESKQVASAYFKDFHLLLIGVICLATSIEKWNFHKRVALRMVMLVGVNPAWLMLGFMVSCAFLSMWLSNTSAAAMVMPIVEAVAQQIIRAETEADVLEMSCSNGSINLALELDENIAECESSDWKKKEKQVNGYDNDVGSTVCTIEKENEKEKKQNLPPTETGRKSKKDKYSGIFKVMCLCVAYSATIGGLTTITGTSTNLIFAEHFNTRYPACQCINFGSWFILSIPITVIILLLSWVWLQWLFLGFDFKNMFKCGKKKTAREEASAQVIQKEYKKLGPMSYPEAVTLVLFILMTLLWFTREPGFIPGWSSLFPKYKGYATDSTTALVIGLLFFIIPAKTLSRTSNGENTVFGYTPLITWKEFQSCMPWEIAILVGGGFALADGCEVSKLSEWVASKLTPLGSLPLWLVILISCLIVTSVTEVASNPATITIFLPILSPLAEAIHVNPLFILIPATLCTSFAFLLPVANPANAIVFSYGHLTIMDMVKAGLGINIVGVAVVMLAIMTWIVPIFDLFTYPSWAPNISATNNTGL